MSSAQQDQQARPRVAVLGIGTMGRGMAHSLLRAGCQVDAWNRTPEPAAQLARTARPRMSCPPTRCSMQTW